MYRIVQKSLAATAFSQPSSCSSADFHRHSLSLLSNTLVFSHLLLYVEEERSSLCHNFTCFTKTWCCLDPPGKESAVRLANYKPRLLLNILQRVFLFLLFCAAHRHFSHRFFFYLQITNSWYNLLINLQVFRFGLGDCWLQLCCSSVRCLSGHLHGTGSFHSREFYPFCFARRPAQRQLSHWSELLDVAITLLLSKGRLWFKQWKQSGWKCLRIPQSACFKTHS